MGAQVALELLDGVQMWTLGRQPDQLYPWPDVGQEVPDGIGVMIGGTIQNEEESLPGKELEQVVEVTPKLGAGGVPKDVIETFSCTHITGAEKPASDGVARRANPRRPANRMVIAATIRTEAEFRLVLDKQSAIPAPERTGTRSFPNASMRRRLTSYRGSGEVILNVVRPRRKPARVSAV